MKSCMNFQGKILYHDTVMYQQCFRYLPTMSFGITELIEFNSFFCDF